MLNRDALLPRQVLAGMRASRPMVGNIVVAVVAGAAGHLATTLRSTSLVAVVIVVNEVVLEVLSAHIKLLVATSTTASERNLRAGPSRLLR